MLTTTPVRLPMLQRASGSRCFSQFEVRRQRTHAIATMYVNVSATSISEIIALKATLEPILMRARAQAIRQVKVMAFIGTKRVG